MQNAPRHRLLRSSLFRRRTACYSASTTRRKEFRRSAQFWVTSVRVQRLFCSVSHPERPCEVLQNVGTFNVLDTGMQLFWDPIRCTVTSLQKSEHTVSQMSSGDEQRVATNDYRLERVVFKVFETISLHVRTWPTELLMDKIRSSTKMSIRKSSGSI